MQKGCLIVLGVAKASLVLTATNSLYAQNERAKMRGNSEVPPVTTSAEGDINFKSKNGMLTWKMNVTGIPDATGAHIHKGKIGTNGDVVFDPLKVSKHSSTPQGYNFKRCYT
jgi:Cu/Zn superoxide dismutase